MDQLHEFQRRSTTRIVVGQGAEAKLPEVAGALRPDGVFVLHDPAVSALATRVATALRGHTIAVDGGERVKRLERVGELAARLQQSGATRGSLLIAVGGGTISDLVGFLAAVYLRGVPFVVCATTTLAACDAALGGKNGVDLGGLKNRLGTIRQPDAVIADPAWLQSLPDEAFREGLVEVVKKAAVLDATAFAELEALAPALAARDVAATTTAIERAVTMKMGIVHADETEGDRRRALNFGHTIGHALESLADGRLRHGAAVAIGMLAECRAAAVPDPVVARLRTLLRRLSVATAVPPELNQAGELWHRAQLDKKATRGNVPMYVPFAIGEGRLVSLTEPALQRALHEA
ncbi:MAG: 3-dehydroquinate synthase [Planctomycetes bacterium]|nr:3-dehydroquinate synthase [Planctomycetota bacterium]